MKRFIIGFGILIFCVGLTLAGYAGFRIQRFLTSAPDEQATEKIVLIERGMPLRQIAERLRGNGIITNTTLFMLLAQLYREGESIKAGEYQFTTSMRPTEVLNKLQSGKIHFRPVTIPEGYTAIQIAELLEQIGLTQKERFLQFAFSKQVAAEFDIEADTLEGYLFPNTYYIHRGMSEEEMIHNMVAEFWKIVSPDVQQEIRQKGFTLHEIVTLASIIEKEARVSEERTLISAVYHNRLQRNMKLDSDPTVIYGLPNFNGNLTRADLRRDSPYNTYTRRGLPPGPIANPGKDSLLAAVRPADVKYLYFVSRNDGTHEFSVTYQDHLRAVRKYQRGRR